MVRFWVSILTCHRWFCLNISEYLYFKKILNSGSHVFHMHICFTTFFQQYSFDIRILSIFNYVYTHIHIYIHMHAESLKSCPVLCKPMDCSPPGSSVHGILQARIWSGLSFPSPGDLHKPGIEPGSPTMQADFSPSEPGKPMLQVTIKIN